LCQEYPYQKLSKSNNRFSSYRRKCRDVFLGHSVCYVHLSVVCNICIVAKWYILSKKLSKEANKVALWYTFIPRMIPHPLKRILTDCTPNTFIVNVAKQLQLVAWLLLTAYRNLTTPYLMAPLLTPYIHMFSQNSSHPQFACQAFGGIARNLCYITTDAGLRVPKIWFVYLSNSWSSWRQKRSKYERIQILFSAIIKQNARFNGHLNSLSRKRGFVNCCLSLFPRI